VSSVLVLYAVAFGVFIALASAYVCQELAVVRLRSPWLWALAGIFFGPVAPLLLFLVPEKGAVQWVPGVGPVRRVR
jgi:hypothetical protein